MTMLELVNRNDAIKRIRAALKQRTGKTWSVKGGRGTAWGWITIDAPPARRTMRTRPREGAPGTRPQDFEWYDSGEPGGTMTPADRETFRAALNLSHVHTQGVSIAASTDYYIEYIDRAEGRTPRVIGTPYWD